MPRLRGFALVSMLLLPAACGLGEPDYWAFSSRGGTVSGSGGSSTRGGFTAVVVWTSDSPVEELTGVRVVFERVEMRRGAERAVLFQGRQEIELLELQNGARRRLAEAQVEAGTYDTLQIRLAAQGHTVERAGGDEPLVLAPGAAAEFRFDGPYRLGAGEALDLQLDFNVRLSVYEANGTWYLAPAGSLHDPATAAALEGTALPAGTRVSAQVDGLEVASTTSRSDGWYRLHPLPEGRYDLVASRTGYRPELERGVRADRASTSRDHHFLLGYGDDDGSLRGVYVAVGGRGLVVRVVWRGAFLALAGVDPGTGAFFFPRLPADEFDVEVWDARGPLGDRRSVFVEPGIESLLEFR